MNESAILLLAIGSILLLGLATDYLGRHTALPRVTSLLILGIILGDQVLGLIPVELSSRFELISNLALMIIGFLIGGRLNRDSLRNSGKQVAWISVSAALGAAILVTLTLTLVGVPLEIAILLGCISSATAPAATVDTVLESGNEGRFANMLLAVVAVDDAWALLLFSLGLSLVALLNGTEDSVATLLQVVREVGGGVLLGGLIGIPAAYLTGRIRQGQPMLTEALGLVFLCGGAALLLDVSLLIAVMTMGAAISNLGRHHEYPFHEIENIEWPFLAVFFVLAGATLEVDKLAAIGLIGLVYVVARTIGKIAGAWLGGTVASAGEPVRNWMGLAMLPQAGVAIGMALITANRFPETAEVVLTVVVTTTVVFELFGPALTRLALARAGRE